MLGVGRFETAGFLTGERGNGVARMTRSQLPPLAAALGTLLLAVAMHLVDAAGEVALPLLGLVATAALLAPLGVPVLWSWALFQGRPLQLVGVVAAAGLGAVFFLFPGEVGAQLVSYALVGLTAAFGLLSRWHPGLVLAAMCGVMIPVIVATTDLEVLDEMFEQQKEETLQARREMLMAQQGEGAEPPALEVEKEALDRMFGTTRQLVPGFIAGGIMLQAALDFWLIWLLARWLKLAQALRGLPPFGYWRFPFALVWLLAGGVGLMIAPRYLGLTDWPPLGANLVLLSVGLVALQGAAVQWRLSPSSMPLPARVVLLFMAGFLFLPLVVLGLADQWLDFRKLDADDNGGNDDAPADKQGG